MTESRGMGVAYGCLPFSATGSPILDAGGRLNKKDGLTRYGNSHVKDKTS